MLKYVFVYLLFSLATFSMEIDVVKSESGAESQGEFITLSKLKSLLKKINKNHGKMNCQECSEILFNALYHQTTNFEVASDTTPKNNILYLFRGSKSAVGYEDGMCKKFCPQLRINNLEIHEECTSYKKSHPVYLPIVDSLREFLNNISLDLVKDSTNYAVGKLLGENKRGKYSHFFAYYVYEDRRKKRVVSILDAQTAAIYTLEEFNQEIFPMFKPVLYYWNNSKDNIDAEMTLFSDFRPYIKKENSSEDSTTEKSNQKISKEKVKKSKRSVDSLKERPKKKRRYNESTKIDEEKNEIDGLQKEIRENIKISSDGLYHCPYPDCDITVTDKSKLVRDHLYIHEKKNYCEECDKAFSNISKLKNHNKKKHPEKLKKPILFFCKVDGCERSINGFTSEYLLNRHQQRHGDARGSIPCRHCSQKFNDDGNRRLHELSRHSTEKKHACDQCEYRAKLPVQLQRHKISRHSTEKKHACDQCEYRAKLPDQLQRHKISRHSTEKNHACDQCEYRAKLPDQLLRHKKIHDKKK